jgi:hypothetical protein
LCRTWFEPICFQDMTLEAVEHALNNHMPHLNQEQQHEWREWLNDVQERTSACGSGKLSFDDDILTAFTQECGQPSSSALQQSTMTLIQGAYLSTESLPQLSTAAVLQAWAPLMKVQRGTSLPSSSMPHSEVRLQMDGQRRARVGTLTAHEAIFACAPPPPATEPTAHLAEDNDVMVHEPVRVGGRKRKTSAKKDLNTNLKQHDMIVMLRPLSHRSKKQPFWMGQVEFWDPHTSDAIIQWFAAVNEDVTWVKSVWGQALTILTQDLYDSLSPQEKGKGRYIERNIGRAVYLSIEKMNLTADYVFHFGFQLTQGGKIPKGVANEMEKRLLLENVQYLN